MVTSAVRTQQYTRGTETNTSTQQSMCGGMKSSAGASQHHRRIFEILIFFSRAMSAKNRCTHDWRLPKDSSTTKSSLAPTLSSMPSRCRGNLAATPTVLWCLASLNLRATIGRSTSSFLPDEPNALSGDSDILAVQTVLCRRSWVDNCLYWGWLEQCKPTGGESEPKIRGGYPLPWGTAHGTPKMPNHTGR